VNPQNGGTGSTAKRSPTTVWQAWRAYVECLHSPLSQRGTAMNAVAGRGDVGLSRYPPAEGERNSPVLGPSPAVSPPPANGISPFTRPGETATPGMGAGPTIFREKGEADGQITPARVTSGSQVNTAIPLPDSNATCPPPIEHAAATTSDAPLPAAPGESEIDDYADVFESDMPASDDTAKRGTSQRAADRDLQRAGGAEIRPLLSQLGLDPLQDIGAGESGTIYQQVRDTGLSRYPPAEGVRTFPAAGGLAAENGPFGQNEAAWYSAHAQGTVVTQVHNVFPSPYIGPRSLLPHEPAANTMTGTVFYAARLWESARNDTQVIFNPEIAGGSGFSGTNGVAGFPNAEATRVGVVNPTPYIARLYVRQNFGFGGEREFAADENNQVAGERDVRRLSVIAGKLAAPDLADDNRYAHDPRTQFLNWALVYNGAWDYPANVRGYTYGAALDYNHSRNLSFVYGIFLEPAAANGAPFDWHIGKAAGQVAEVEKRYELNGRPGALRLMTFLNHAHMGNYNEALQLMPVDPDITKTRSYRYKYGYCLSFDQALTDDVGCFCRLGWNDGHSESWAFTEIDRTASAGLVMGGRWWCRPNDRIGLAGVLNGISGPHRDYLAAGGIGFIIGDGKLSYGLEQILETYYAWRITNGIVVTLDFQEIVNPGYNTDRGPVEVGSIRVHWDH
jgi:high affinity Mn2+ porin